MIAAGKSLPGAPGRRAGRLTRWSRWHPEWALGAVCVLAWASIVGLSAGGSHGMHEARSQAVEWLSLQGHWLLMTVAMMVPAALPMARVVARNSKFYRRQRAIFLFAGSSLLVWVAFGIAAVTVAVVVDLPAWLLGASLLGAALWELTPAKKRALKACHRMIPLPPDGRKADRADIRLGLQYGRACFRACWALMLPMAVAAHVSPFLMLILTAIAVGEEVAVKGYRLAPAAAVVLTVAGLMVLVLG